MNAEPQSPSHKRLYRREPVFWKKPKPLTLLVVFVGWPDDVTDWLGENAEHPIIAWLTNDLFTVARGAHEAACAQQA